MKELIFLEMKKIYQKKLMVIVTLGYLLAIILFFFLPYLQYKAWDRDSIMLSRKEAVLYRKMCYNTLAGSLTERLFLLPMRQQLWH